MRANTFPKSWGGRFDRLGIPVEIRESLTELDSAVADVAVQIAAAEAARAEEARPDFNPRLLARELADLPQDLDEVWEADIRRAPAWVTGEGEPYRPWLAMVASRTRDRVLVPEVGAERPDARQLMAMILRAMRQESLRPARVELADATLLETIAEGLEPAGVAAAAAAGGLPAIDRMSEALADATDEPDTLRPLSGVPGVTEAMQRSLYAAAADFFRARPWRAVPPDSVIDIREPGPEGRLVQVVVMGQSGVQQGLAIYDDPDTLAAALAGDEEGVARGTSLAVMFGEAFEIHAADHDRIERCGFEVAGPEAWPLVIRLNPGFATRPPLAWEVKLITACLGDLPAFLKAVPRPGRSGAAATPWAAPSGQHLSWA